MRHEGLTVNELKIKKLVLDRGDTKESRKNIESIGGEINFNITTPFTVSLGIIPKGAKLISVIADVETAFNATTTNVLVVGSAADDDAYAAAGDVDEASATYQTVSGKRAEFTADTEVFAKYTQTGTAASTGKAHITMLYSY